MIIEIMSDKIVIAITGASGAIYARRLLDKLSVALPGEDIRNVGVVFSGNARDIWTYELKETPGPENIPFRVWEKTDFSAPFASGSAGYDTMIIIPCSMGTLGRIANGISDDLITRAADVILKERKRLIVVTRELPFNLIHLRNMVTLAEAGAIMVPASPSFYSLPATLEEAVDTVVNRVMDLAGVGGESFRWGE